MAIKIGDTEIKAIKFGDTPINKVMLGDRLVWESYSGNIFKGIARNANDTFDIYINDGTISVTSDENKKWQYRTTTPLTSLRILLKGNKTYSVDLSHINTENVKSFYAVFDECYNIHEIKGINGWNTKNVTEMSYFANSCKELVGEFDLSRWDTGRVRGFRSFMSNCRRVSTVGDISRWDMSSANEIRYMFKQCMQLDNIGIPTIKEGLDTSDIFYECKSLSNIINCANIYSSLSFSYSPLTLQSAIKILDALQPVSTPQTITFSAYTTTLINESDVALGKVFDAIRKGWSIVGEGLIQTDDVAFFNDPETRMPTREEFEELRDNTTTTIEDGCMIYKSKINDNSIIFPLAGRINGNTYYSVGFTGFYITSFCSDKINCQYFYMYSQEKAFGGNIKCQGRSVRAVSMTKGVDLGLPSGIKWMECNVGANTPTEYGNYYAWGELAPKTDYSWATYKFNPSGDGTTITKYNSTDGLRTLQIKY